MRKQYQILLHGLECRSKHADRRDKQLSSIPYNDGALSSFALIPV